MLCMEHRCQKDSFLNDGKRKKPISSNGNTFPIPLTSDTSQTTASTSHPRSSDRILGGLSHSLGHNSLPHRRRMRLNLLSLIVLIYVANQWLRLTRELSHGGGLDQHRPPCPHPASGRSASNRLSPRSPTSRWAGRQRLWAVPSE